MYPHHLIVVVAKARVVAIQHTVDQVVERGEVIHVPRIDEGLDALQLIRDVLVALDLTETLLRSLCHAEGLGAQQDVLFFDRVGLVLMLDGEFQLCQNARRRVKRRFGGADLDLARAIVAELVGREHRNAQRIHQRLMALVRVADVAVAVVFQPLCRDLDLRFGYDRNADDGEVLFSEQEQDHRTVREARLHIRGLDPFLFDALALRTQLHITADAGLLQGQRETQMDAENGELALDLLIALRAGHSQLGGDRHGDALGRPGGQLVVQHLADDCLVKPHVGMLLVRHDLDGVRHAVLAIRRDGVAVHVGNAFLGKLCRDLQIARRALALRAKILDKKRQTERPVAKFGVFRRFILLRVLELVRGQTHILLCEYDLRLREREHDALREYAARPLQSERNHALGADAVLRHGYHRRLIAVGDAAVGDDQGLIRRQSLNACGQVVALNLLAGFFDLHNAGIDRLGLLAFFELVAEVLVKQHPQNGLVLLVLFFLSAAVGGRRTARRGDRAADAGDDDLVDGIVPLKLAGLVGRLRDDFVLIHGVRRFAPGVNPRLVECVVKADDDAEFLIAGFHGIGGGALEGFGFITVVIPCIGCVIVDLSDRCYVFGVPVTDGTDSMPAIGIGWAGVFQNHIPADRGARRGKALEKDIREALVVERHMQRNRISGPVSLGRHGDGSRYDAGCRASIICFPYLPIGSVFPRNLQRLRLPDPAHGGKKVRIVVGHDVFRQLPAAIARRLRVQRKQRKQEQQSARQSSQKAFYVFFHLPVSSQSSAEIAVTAAKPSAEPPSRLHALSSRAARTPFALPAVSDSARVWKNPLPLPSPCRESNAPEIPAIVAPAFI